MARKADVYFPNGARYCPSGKHVLTLKYDPAYGIVPVCGCTSSLASPGSPVTKEREA